MEATEPPPPQPGQQQFPCKHCGANLVFAPGTTGLQCPYCGTLNEIALSEDPVEELDYHAHVAQLIRAEPTQETLTVKCTACGAESDLTHDVAADRCPFCGAGIVATHSSKKTLKPRSLLPFYVTHQQAGEAYRQWVSTRWFAPNDLVKAAQRSRIDGVYIPAWTYDSRTFSSYTGERGDDYWDTETYTTVENGRTVTRTRQVRKTRWTYVSGRVSNNFDDVLVLASQSLPLKHAAALEPWDLKQLIPYRDEYLSGFAAETYQVNLEEGFERAKGIMDGYIRETIRRDIGGDHQRIHRVNTRYEDISFKHILLPVWISAYRYHDKVYRFLVNARTGEVQGERPYSPWKIAFLVLTIVALFILFAVLTQR